MPNGSSLLAAGRSLPAEKQSPRRGKSPGAMLALASIGKLKMVKDFPLPVDPI